jgi:hypothetical protein
MTRTGCFLVGGFRVSHTDEYPRMAAAARDFLAILVAVVSVERLFNSGRDLKGIRRYSLTAETIRGLVLLRDMFKSEKGSIWNFTNTNIYE